MTDNRAFGYIYGSPENGHRFFGIKTEKAAGQVVVAMRDLFQVVFELKKKEIVMDFRQNLKKVPHLPKVLPDSDTKQPKKKLANKFEEGMRKRKEANYEDTIAIGRKQEEQEENEGRKSITPRPKSKEGAGGKEASSDKKWPKSTKILVDYFKKFENSSEQSGRKFENLGGRIKDSAGDYK